MILFVFAQITMLFFIALIYLQACFVTAVTPRYAARHSPDMMDVPRSTAVRTTIIPDTRSTAFTVTCTLSPSRTSPILESNPTSSARYSLGHFKGTRSVTRTRIIQLHTASPSPTLSYSRSKVPCSTTTAAESTSSVNIIDGTTKATGTHLSSAELTSILASATPSGHSNDVSNAGTLNISRFRTRAIIGLGCIWGVFGFF